jgi:hypothetical protein
MHAHSPDVVTAATVDHSVGICGEVISKEVRGGCRKLILFFASAVTGAATNTKSAIEE